MAPGPGVNTGLVCHHAGVPPARFHQAGVPGPGCHPHRTPTDRISRDAAPGWPRRPRQPQYRPATAARPRAQPPTAYCPRTAYYRRISFRVVSDVWQIRCRVLLERLEMLAHRLREKQPVAEITLDENIARLLVGVVMLLRQHRVNQWGQCRYCAWTSRTWQWSPSRPQCTVYLSLDFAMSQPLDLVWGQLLAGHKTRPGSTIKLRFVPWWAASSTQW